MNENQRRYAFRRTEEILIEKRKRLVERYTKPAVILSVTEKLALIRMGSVSLIQGLHCTSWTKLVDAFDFSSHEFPEKVDREKLDEAEKLLNQKYTEVRDKIILGGENDALRLLKELSNLDV